MKVPDRPLLRFRIESLTEADELFIERWKKLSNEAIEPNPYHDPRFLLPSVRHRPDARQLRLGIVEDGSALLAVIAFSIDEVFADLRMRAVSTTGPFMAQVGDMRHPLMSPRDPVGTWKCLLVGLHRSRLPGLLELDNFPGDGLLFEALAEAASQLGMPVLERRRDERAFARSSEEGSNSEDSGDLFALEHGSSKGEKERARHRRALENALGSELTVEDRGNDPDAVEQFLDLEAAGWKGDASKGGHALRLTGHDTWFTDVAAAFRADGRLTLQTVTSGGVVVYMGVSLQVGNGMFGCLDTYDERFAKYRAGSIGRIANWKRTLTDPTIRFFDPNLGSFYVDSTRLFPHRRPHVTLLLATGGAFSRTLVRAVPALHILREAIKSRRAH